MASKLQQYPTAEAAHFKINSLLAKLGRPALPESEMIAYMDAYLAKIDKLESELYPQKDNAPAAQHAATPTPSVTPAPANVAAKTELYGIARAAQALREGRTQKPKQPTSLLPETGYGRAARAQMAINERRNKS
jgi:hypothetical protein